jgi:DNA polymerase III subunit delta
MPVVIIAGDEEFQISRAARAMKDKLVDPQWESFNFARIENPDLKQVVDAAATVPFGPGNRMVLFDQCALFTKKRGAKDDSESASAAKSSKLVDDFEAAIKSVAPNTYLVFACIANFDKTLKASKAVEKHASFQTFEKIKPWSTDKLIDFCNKEAHRFSAYIEDNAAIYLGESSEYNLRQVSSEIEKAATYILPEKTIRFEHVVLLSPHFSDVFALMEFWALGERQKVLASIGELRAKNVSPHMVLGGAQTVLSKWVYYKTEHEKMMAVPGGGRDVRKRDVPLRDVANRIDARSAFMIEKDLRKIKGLSLDFLVGKKRELTDLEHMVKTGQMPEGHVLEAFFTR